MDSDRGKLTTYLTFFLLFGLIQIANAITSSVTASWGAIYEQLFVYSMIAALIASISGLEFTDIEIFGSARTEEETKIRLTKALGIGALLIILVVILPSSGSFFEFFNLNPQLESFSIVSSTLIGTLLIVQVIAPEEEEMFFRSILNPTFKKLLRKKNGLPITLIFFGLVILSLLNQAIGYIIILGGIIFWLTGKGDRLSMLPQQSLWQITLLAFLITSIMFGIFHAKVYSNLSNPLNAILGATGFGFVVSIVNEYVGNAISSRMIHSIVNGMVMVSIYHVSILLVFLFTGLYAIMIIIIFNLKLPDIIRIFKTGKIMKSQGPNIVVE